MTPLSKLNEYELALANNETYYRSHFPCPMGHYQRYTKSKNCQPCHKMTVERARENGQHFTGRSGPPQNPKTHVTVDKPCKNCGGFVRYRKRPTMCVPCQQKRAIEWLHPEISITEPPKSQENSDREYFLTKTTTYKKNNSTITT